jgi:hypothetical protein
MIQPIFFCSDNLIAVIFSSWELKVLLVKRLVEDRAKTLVRRVLPALESNPAKPILRRCKSSCEFVDPRDALHHFPVFPPVEVAHPADRMADVCSGNMRQHPSLHLKAWPVSPTQTPTRLAFVLNGTFLFLHAETRALHL